MPERSHKIPLLLKLKRFKNSVQAEKINSIFSLIKPAGKYKGKPNSILLIRNDRIGDAVVTLPVIRNLKLNYPELQVDVLVSERNKFVFDDFNYADNVIEFNWTPQHLRKIYLMPLVGGFLQFFIYALIPYLFSGSYRKRINRLRAKKYDAAVDLVGLFRNAILSKLISRFNVGPKKFAVHIAYNYYIDSNWVSCKDSDFMTNKIQKAVENALGLSVLKKDTSLPLIKINTQKQSASVYDVMFHLGTSQLRKLSTQKEKDIIELMDTFNVLVTDSFETPNYIELKDNFRSKDKIDFKIFSSLREAASECLNSKILLCYDGGQAHYLSQFVKTFSIFGPGSASLWRPFEFAGYTLLEENPQGVRVFQSGGKFRHISIHKPIWCSPCFDVGCKEKPCLSQIDAEFVWKIIKKYGLQND